MKIVSTLIISFIGWIATGYDFFAILTIASIAIDLYQSLNSAQKRLNKILKIKRKIRK